jgi:hypothetical protein
MTFDCALYMADVDQTWQRSFLYDPAKARAGVDSVGAPSPAD